MRWLDVVKRDPVPWLLDPANPSARYLTLRDIFDTSAETLQEARQAILKWSPIRAIIAQSDPVNFWGRANNPYYGGVAGTFGILYTLTQLGVPPFPEALAACENLLNQGRTSDGRFALDESPSSSWLCYTGIALQTLWAFGFGNDIRTRSAQTALVHTIHNRQELLKCPIAAGLCQWGLAKTLAALLCIPAEQRLEDDDEAILVLGNLLLNHLYDFTGRDLPWVQPTFPRYYNSDLAELCHLLVRTPHKNHPRLREFLQRLIEMQTEDGQWRKVKATPTLSVERIHQPSRWLTYEVTHTLTLYYGGNNYAGQG